MQIQCIARSKPIRLIGLAIAAVALVTLLVLSGRSVLAGQGGQPATSLQEGRLSMVLAEPTAIPSPEAKPGPIPNAEGTALCSGNDCTVTSHAGWQPMPLTLRQGAQFSIAYLSGSWTVDKRNWPFVGPAGYSSDIDQQIGYAGTCKVGSRWPYAALLGKIGDGPVFLVGGGGAFATDRDGILYLTINDHPVCQGDNEGSIVARILTLPCARLSIVPSYKEIAAGGAGATEAQVANVANLYGAQFRLAFNPSVAQVADADPNTSGVQVGIGALFSGKDYFVAKNQVDNANGVIEFAVTLRAPAAPIAGSGALAVITWQGKHGGQSALTLTQTGLADPNGQSVCHQVENGNLQVSPVQTVSGRVLLQCGVNHAGANVFLTEGPRVLTTKITVEELANVPLAVTDAAGRFGITPDASRHYQWLWVYRAGYLTGAQRWPQGNLGTLTLPAGDVNEDNCINIFDLTKMASQCLGTNNCPVADFTQDGKVDIYDLVCMASNFGRCGSVDNWQP